MVENKRKKLKQPKTGEQSLKNQRRTPCPCDQRETVARNWETRERTERRDKNETKTTNGKERYANHLRVH